MSGSVSSHGGRIDSFRQGLRELGYVEGKNIFIEYRYDEGKRERFDDLAAEMVRLKPEVIYARSTGFASAGKKATSTIPIVATGGDLVGSGLAASLAQPGGNVTGSTNMSPDVSGKRLELLKEAVPRAKR
ncbi:MAG TPA: ABC transporter substrate-binding protein, partial [Candidatus Limnocylindria bacterium]|nr:ABC transporter substrate-binding protein [Candidatus Limnocylindria bacterium]